MRAWSPAPWIAALLAAATIGPAAAVATGDLNGNGKVDVLDAIQALQSAVGLRTPKAEEIARADLSGNGRLDVLDAIQILQIAAGLRPPVSQGPVEVSVSVTPRARILAGGGSVALRAEVSGTTNTAVTWSVPDAAAGSVTPDGVYTAPATPGVYRVVATSVADPSATSDAYIAVPQPVAGGGQDAAKLLSLRYSHVKDSDGTTPVTGATVSLSFEANGKVHLMAADEKSPLAYEGTYTYQGGSLTLKLPGPDFVLDVTAPVDSSAATISLPFKLFSDGAGTSTWQRASSLETNLRMLFTSLVYEKDLGATEAVQKVQTYCNTALAQQQRQAAGAASPLKSEDRSPEIIGTRPLDNGVTLVYADGREVDVALYGWATGEVDNAPALSMAPLASDPRVHINAKAPGRNIYDPTHKTALFVAPFKSNKYFGVVNFLRVLWDSKMQEKYPGWTPINEGIEGNGSTNFEYGAMGDLLEDHHYDVTEVFDTDATVERLIEELLKSPGFVVVNTHGMSNGAIATGVLLGTDDASAAAGFQEAVKALEAGPYKDLIAYKDCLSTMSMPRGMNPAVSSYYLSLTPRFWQWLRTRTAGPRADFSTSLVYLASCLTDKSDLRSAVKARAYFGWNVTVPPPLAGATFQYLVKSLVRPTHSAEESYYNVLRIANTRLMIYPEDKLFDYQFNQEAVSKQRRMQELFNGYFLSPQGRVEAYKSAGWLTMGDQPVFEGVRPDPGAVWWLLFAGRWGADVSGPDAGADGLMRCWNDFWQARKQPGLADPGCNAKDPGHLPTPDEVSYATYLLTGSARLPFSGVKATRWTLDDGATD